MICGQVHELLSAYRDGELSADLSRLAAEHIQECPNCSAELAVFERVTGAFQALRDPQPPQEIWTGIEAGLAEDDRRPVRWVLQQAEGSPTLARIGLVAAAALVFIAVGVTWSIGWPWDGSRHDKLPAGMEAYVAIFASSPGAAQNLLLASHNGRPIDMTEAARRLGYRPAIAGGPPAGWSLEGTYVLEMPCCTCAQILCRREDGRLFAIFEHADEHPLAMGEGARTEIECEGHACTIIESEGQLVVTWPAGGRRLVVVGAHEREEVAELVAHFGSESRGA